MVDSSAEVRDYIKPRVAFFMQFVALDFVLRQELRLLERRSKNCFGPNCRPDIPPTFRVLRGRHISIKIVFSSSMLFFSSR
jgi:hypothetical protein